MLTGMPRFLLGTTLLLGLFGGLNTAHGQGSKSKGMDIRPRIGLQAPSVLQSVRRRAKMAVSWRKWLERS